MKKALFALVLPLAVLAFGAGPVAAQGWTLDFQGGRVAYRLAESNPGENGVVLGVRYRDRDRRWLYASSGIPLGSGDTMWGAMGLGTRLARSAGPFDLGVDLAGHGYLYRDPTLMTLGGGGVAEARPLIGFGAGPLRLEARSGWVQYGRSLAGTSYSRGAHDSDLTLDLSVSRWARLSGTARHVRAEEGDYSFGGARLAVGSSRLSAWGSVGAWTSDALPTTEWGAGASVRVGERGRTAIHFSVRQDATDPVYWNAPRRRWSVGVSYRLGDRDDSSFEAGRSVVRMGPEISSGRVTIRIPAADSTSAPSVAGDFTGWRPVPMVEDGEHWTASFDLQPGVYQYAFRSSSGEWYVPESIPGRRTDGMGGFVAVLVIS